MIFAALAVVCAFAFWSCKKDDPNNPGGGSGGGGGAQVTDEFRIEIREEGVFPANAQQIFNLAPVGQRVPAFSDNFPSNVDATLASKNTSRDKVVSIKGDTMRVKLLNNPTQNFDFMDSVWVYVSKLDGSNQELFGTSLGYSLGLRELDLLMTRTDVKEVFNADSVKLSLVGTKRAGNHSIQSGTEVEFFSSVLGVFSLVP